MSKQEYWSKSIKKNSEILFILDTYKSLFIELLNLKR